MYYIYKPIFNVNIEEMNNSARRFFLFFYNNQQKFNLIHNNLSLSFFYILSILNNINLFKSEETFFDCI